MIYECICLSATYNKINRTFPARTHHHTLRADLRNRVLDQLHSRVMKRPDVVIIQESFAAHDVSGDLMYFIHPLTLG